MIRQSFVNDQDWKVVLCSGLLQPNVLASVLEYRNTRKSSCSSASISLWSYESTMHQQYDIDVCVRACAWLIQVLVASYQYLIDG